jgi:membrane protease YdiL (CAAX protease family)
MIPALTWGRIWPPALIFLVAIGFTEELVFRGVVQRSSLGVMGSWGLVYTAAVFSALHLGYLSWIHWGFVFFIGLFFSWVVKKTGSILGVSLSHGITNIGLYLIIPFIF